MLHDDICNLIDKLDANNTSHQRFFDTWNMITDINTNEIKEGYLHIAKELLEHLKQLEDK